MAENKFNVDEHPVKRYIDSRLDGSGGGGGSAMDARVAKLEASVSHIENDVREIKTDLRKLLTLILGSYAALAAAFLTLAGIMGTGYFRLSDKIEGAAQRIEQVVSKQSMQQSAPSQRK